MAPPPRLSGATPRSRRTRYKAWCIEVSQGPKGFEVRAYATPAECDRTGLCGDYWAGGAKTRPPALKKGKRFVDAVKKTGKLPPVKNPIEAKGVSMVGEGDRNVDEMARRAAVFGAGLAQYFDRYRARYEIGWGVTPEGDVTITDDTGTYEKKVDAFFKVVVNQAFGDEKPPEGEMEAVGDALLEQSGLGEFLFYDGWESGNVCSSDPRQWPSNFWYEEDRTGRLYTYEGFAAHCFRPHILNADAPLPSRCHDRPVAEMPGGTPAACDNPTAAMARRSDKYADPYWTNERLLEDLDVYRKTFHELDEVLEQAGVEEYEEFEEVPEQWRDTAMDMERMRQWADEIERELARRGVAIPDDPYYERPAAPAKPDLSADIELIQRRRRELLMPPLDVSGWTPEDIREYARQIRHGNPAERPFKFWLACPQMTAELVQYITDPDRTVQIQYATFARHADLEPLRAQGHPAMYRISAPDNWAISFWRSSLPSGAPIYYFDWSRIEHVFVDRPVDFSAEVRGAERWARSGYGNGSARNPTVDPVEGLTALAPDEVFVRVQSHRARSQVHSRLGYAPQSFYTMRRKLPAATSHYVLPKSEFDKIASIKGVGRARFRRADEWQASITMLNPGVKDELLRW